MLVLGGLTDGVVTQAFGLGGGAGLLLLGPEAIGIGQLMAETVQGAGDAAEFIHAAGSLHRLFVATGVQRLDRGGQPRQRLTHNLVRDEKQAGQDQGQDDQPADHHGDGQTV
ncbi:hypothetical protein D3C80_1421240 [compost metagenome]